MVNSLKADKKRGEHSRTEQRRRATSAMREDLSSRLRIITTCSGN